MPEATHSADYLKVSVTILLILALITVFAMLAFRLPVSSAVLDILSIKTSQLIIAIAAGAAFALAGIRQEGDYSPVSHIHGFTSITLGLSTLLGVLMLGGSMILAISFGAIITFISYRVSQQLTQAFTNANFLLAITLVITFILWIYAFGAASALAPKWLWLMGDINTVANSNAAMLLAIGLLGIWLFTTDKSANKSALNEQTPRLLLLGMGFGLAGPLFFVGWLSPTIADKLIQQRTRPLYYLYTALLGIFMVIAAHTASQLLFGGYAPPVMLLIGIIGILTSLEWNRRRLFKHYPNQTRSRIELGFIIIGALFAAFVFSQIGLYVGDVT